MTDRISHLTVALEHDLRADDVEYLTNAIRCLRGVADVKANMRDGGTYADRQQLRYELREALWKVLDDFTEGRLPKKDRR
jgi:hypothetical protein